MVIGVKNEVGTLLACRIRPIITATRPNALIGKAKPGSGITFEATGRHIMIRYGFNIRTKHGQRVDNIQIMAATQTDAERRLRQMYHYCEIVECSEQSVPRRVDTLDVEGIIGMISAASPSLQKAGTH